MKVIEIGNKLTLSVCQLHIALRMFNQLCFTVTITIALLLLIEIKNSQAVTA